MAKTRRRSATLRRAALALLVNGSSAMAFAALALNRLVGYACAGLTVLAFQARRAFIRK